LIAWVMSASVFCTEIQPSPRRAARRSPGSDNPPIEIGTAVPRRRHHQPVEVVVPAVVHPLRATAAHEAQDLDHLQSALAPRLHLGRVTRHSGIQQVRARPARSFASTAIDDSCLTRAAGLDRAWRRW
jgi:hypothetical protein